MWGPLLLAGLVAGGTDAARTADVQARLHELRRRLSLGDTVAPRGLWGRIERALKVCPRERDLLLDLALRQIPIEELKDLTPAEVRERLRVTQDPILGSLLGWIARETCAGRLLFDDAFLRSYSRRVLWMNEGICPTTCTILDPRIWRDIGVVPGSVVLDWSSDIGAWILRMTFTRPNGRAQVVYLRQHKDAPSGFEIQRSRIHAEILGRPLGPSRWSVRSEIEGEPPVDSLTDRAGPVTHGGAVEHSGTIFVKVPTPAWRAHFPDADISRMIKDRFGPVFDLGSILRPLRVKHQDIPTLFRLAHDAWNARINLLNWALDDLKDWIEVTTPDLHQFFFSEAWAACEAWHRAFLAPGYRGPARRTSQDPIVATWADGWTVVQLRSRPALESEGISMNHCVGSHVAKVRSGDAEVYSLRDARGVPQATLELRVGHSVERGPTTWFVHDFNGPDNQGVQDPLAAHRAIWMAHAIFPRGIPAGTVLARTPLQHAEAPSLEDWISRAAPETSTLTPR